MRRVFLWAARNRLVEGQPPAVPVHAARRRPVHAGRDDRGRARRGASAPGGRRHVDVHPARREPRARRRGRGDRRPLPRGHRQDRRGRDQGRDLGEADPARHGPRSRDLLRSSRADRRQGGRRRLVPLDRHGIERLRRTDDRPVRTSARRPAADRDLPAGLSPPDRRRHRAAAARSTRPSGSSRVPTTRRHRSPTRASRTSTRTTSAWRSGSCSAAAVVRSGWASGRTTSR